MAGETGWRSMAQAILREASVRVRPPRQAQRTRARDTGSEKGKSAEAETVGKGGRAQATGVDETGRTGDKDARAEKEKKR
eukprot:6207500-Pleurochrysis_carterae.AAC.1